jgi:hypothetical protein
MGRQSIGSIGIHRNETTAATSGDRVATKGDTVATSNLINLSSEPKRTIDRSGAFWIGQR